MVLNSQSGRLLLPSVHLETRFAQSHCWSTRTAQQHSTQCTGTCCSMLYVRMHDSSLQGELLLMCALFASPPTQCMPSLSLDTCAPAVAEAATGSVRRLPTCKEVMEFNVCSGDNSSALLGELSSDGPPGGSRACHSPQRAGAGLPPVPPAAAGSHHTTQPAAHPVLALQPQRSSLLSHSPAGAAAGACCGSSLQIHRDSQCQHGSPRVRQS